MNFDLSNKKSIEVQICFDYLFRQNQTRSVQLYGGERGKRTSAFSSDIRKKNRRVGKTTRGNQTKL